MLCLYLATGFIYILLWYRNKAVIHTPLSMNNCQYVIIHTSIILILPNTISFFPPFILYITCKPFNELKSLHYLHQYRSLRWPSPRNCTLWCPWSRFRLLSKTKMFMLTCMFSCCICFKENGACVLREMGNYVCSYYLMKCISYAAPNLQPCRLQLNT